MRPAAPGVAHALARDPDATWLDLRGVRSLRGIERFPRLEHLAVPASARLDALTRLAGLRTLMLEYRPLVGLEALRALEIAGCRCTDLSPLAELPLERLVLDNVAGVGLRGLRGSRLERLDLWNSPVPDPEVLATLPALREVWLFGLRLRTLEHLRHLGEGALVVLDGVFDPDASRDDLARLEDRGVRVFASDDPHAHGVFPSWWRWTGEVPDDPDRAPVVYATRPVGG
ncbi:MAG: hypothetical protein H6738_12405 [Alphaproteobacteria bacterium]|nr:hypothetical protein [Alphaproteobacteria bacterium]